MTVIKTAKLGQNYGCKRNHGTKDETAEMLRDKREKKNTDPIDSTERKQRSLSAQQKKKRK
jgi:hypothetical protein